MPKAFWVRCEDCEHEYATDFEAEHGLLFACHKSGEECIECGSANIEVVNECEVD